ncbi:MAG TPA: methyltransferase domain-containing protein [Rhodothermales bacterium]|nr:methyltransferase domain-containing protein [Rhodothermales bacterium]
MSFSAINGRILATVSEWWPNPKKDQKERFGAEPGSVEYAQAYALDQYMRKVRSGISPFLYIPSLWGKDVLEIGCGHGGITCYLASIGARHVTGIDINVENLRFAEELLQHFELQRGSKLTNIEFCVMNATELEFADESFDVIVADNLFEHVMEPEQVLKESRRVLRHNGVLIVPLFSSIHSKYGPHLKHGLKLPWVNFFYSDSTIISAMQHLSRRHPEMLQLYPGLSDDPKTLRDLRRYKDLNYITYKMFKKMAVASGFRIDQFHIHGTILGKLLRRMFPGVANTYALEVLSTGASALLIAD